LLHIVFSHYSAYGVRSVRTENMEISHTESGELTPHLSH
jgi:hypothetical protein